MSCFASEEKTKVADIEQIVSKRDSVMADYFPPNWKVTTMSSIDLNRDGIEDKVAVIEALEAIKKVNDSDNFGNDLFYPKKIFIFFQDIDGKISKELDSSTIFGTTNWGIQGMDAFRGIKKDKNSFWLSFTNGGTAHFVYDYKFQYINGDFKLTSIDGNFQEFSSIDFLNGVMEQFEFQMDEESNPVVLDSIVTHHEDGISKIFKVKIPKKPLYLLKDFSAQWNEFFQ